jgi:hypothetical protein
MGRRAGLSTMAAPLSPWVAGSGAQLQPTLRAMQLTLAPPTPSPRTSAPSSLLAASSASLRSSWRPCHLAASSAGTRRSLSADSASRSAVTAAVASAAACSCSLAALAGRQRRRRRWRRERGTPQQNFAKASTARQPWCPPPAAPERLLALGRARLGRSELLLQLLDALRVACVDHRGVALLADRLRAEGGAGTAGWVGECLGATGGQRLP